MPSTATHPDMDADLMARLESKLHNALMSHQDLQELNNKRKRSDKLGTNANQDFPTWKIQKKRTGDRAAAKARLQVLDAKPIAMFDGKQVVNMGSSTSNEYECTTCHKSFPTHQALGGHRSSHYVRDENDPKQRIHTCTICLRTFPSGQDLVGHKRFHYEAPLIIKHKAPSAGTSLMPASQENSPSQSDCVKLFGVDLKKSSQAQEDKGINLDTTSSTSASQENSPSQTDCVMLFGIDLKLSQQAQEDKGINLDTTSSVSSSQANSPSQTYCVRSFGIDLKKLSQVQEDTEINLDLTL